MRKLRKRFFSKPPLLKIIILKTWYWKEVGVWYNWEKLFFSNLSFFLESKMRIISDCSRFFLYWSRVVVNFRFSKKGLIGKNGFFPFYFFNFLVLFYEIRRNNIENPSNFDKGISSLLNIIIQLLNQHLHTLWLCKGYAQQTINNGSNIVMKWWNMMLIVT